VLRFTLPAVFALGLIAGGARAEEPKARPINLEDLKHAVTVADKRGDNVGLIREALIAFEKALATSAAKPGDAPPELAALREAVEATAKKGENVEAISKELGLIEKALTGRAYARPKPPEPKPEPEPTPEFPMRRGGGNWNGGRGIGIGGGAWNGRGAGGGNNGAMFSATTITITNNAFTIRARQGDVTFIVSGSLDGNEAPKITIQDGDKKTETDDVKKVPDAHRPAVERLLKMVQRG
jgi:hypothetical protein